MLLSDRNYSITEKKDFLYRGGRKQMLFTTTNDHEELRAAIRGFAETKVKPIAFSLDKESKFPTEIVKEMGENGWMGLPYPKEYGGAGMDYIACHCRRGTGPC